MNINVAEAVIEPFGDRNFTSIRSWEITGVSKPEYQGKWWDSVPQSHYINGDGYKAVLDKHTGAYVEENWSGVVFGWANAYPNHPVIEMEKAFKVDCERFDRLILSAMIPQHATLQLDAVTDAGPFSATYEATGTKKDEYVLELLGAKRLEKVRIILFAPPATAMTGHFQFLMLQSSGLEAQYVKSLQCENEDWTPWLKTEDYVPSFKPMYGILADENTIAQLQQSLDMTQIIKDAKAAPEPELSVSDYVTVDSDSRFPRKRDYDKGLSIGMKVAFAGIIAKDAGLLRKAARYALSIASCQFWHEGFICRNPGFLFDHKAFAPSVYCRTVATIMDLAGELFTNAGISFLLRRLGEEGIGSINWVIWKYSVPPEDIFAINQLVWFSWGRLPAYTILDQHWRKSRPYTDLAFEEVCESVNQIILPDGGYEEGPTYFISVAKMAGEALYWYARSRKLNLQEIIPQPFLKTEDYAQCLLSIDESHSFIPVADAACDVFAPDSFALLAALMPQSHWVTLFRRSWARHKANVTDFLTLLLEPTIPQAYSQMRSFISMPDTGAVSSVRSFEGERVKLFQCGGNANANHAHQDKGSFVLQAAGETIAADPGIGKYDDNIGASLGGFRWHSILVPLVSGASAPVNRLPCDVKPIASGDETTFQSYMDLTPSWSDAYKKWERRIDSPVPNRISITDTYELNEGEGVVFSLITPLAVTFESDMVILEGERTKTVIKIQEGCQGSLEQMPEYNGKRLNRVLIQKNQPSGTLITEMTIHIKKGSPNGLYCV